MNEVNCMSEEELRAHLKKMEKNKEELKFQEQRIWKEEEEEDEQIYAALVGLEHMREYAGENEKIILLIDEQKSILDNIRLRKSLRKESKVVQTKKQYGDFSLTALSFASISIFSGCTKRVNSIWTFNYDTLFIIG